MDHLPPKPPLYDEAKLLCDAIKNVLRLEEELSIAKDYLTDLIATPSYLYSQPNKQHE